MRNFLSELKSFFRKGDMVLLVMCLAISAFGCLVIASVTNAEKFGDSTRYIVLQILTTGMGVVAYAVMSSIDLEFLSEHRWALIGLTYFLLFLLIPFGTDNNTGNKSWIPIPIVNIHVQPAEICKIFYIVYTASIMQSHQNRLSSFPSVMHLAGHMFALIITNLVISGDAGVTLIFVFIFAAMAWSGGVKLRWFFAGGGLIAAAWPVLWNYVMDPHQKQRILALFDPSIDPLGIGVRHHYKQSLLSLTGGGMVGQGLFNGNRTQSGALFAQHTDFVFSSIGEELGYLGCLLVALALLTLVGRCIWVGTKSPDYMRKLVCFGAAAALMFQIIINIGMCIGVMPVIGLTLPLISYGGSSIVTIYAMLGLVSGVHARPSPRSHERYIQPPRIYY